MEKLKFVVVVDVELVGDGLPVDELKAALSLELQAALNSKAPILDVNENPAGYVRHVDVVWRHE